MYIQITSRCNMTCAHCCYECGPAGVDMPLAMFDKAMNVGLELGHPCVAIGGGEPTVHPRFWSIVQRARAFAAKHGTRRVWLATNGKRTADALRLADMTRRGELAATLSLDDYHEPIAEAVVEAFSEIDHFAVRSIRTSTVFASGRAKAWGADECINPCPHVAPDGTIYGCGCRATVWGSLWDYAVSDDVRRCAWHTGGRAACDSRKREAICAER